MSDFQIFVGLLSVVPLSLASIRLQLTGLVARAHRQTVLHVHPSESDALPVSAMFSSQEPSSYHHSSIACLIYLLRSDTSKRQSQQSDQV